MAELSQELRTVLLADQRERSGGGTHPSIDTYLSATPELAADREAVLDLIYQETVLREEAGERPDVEEYVRRFPQWETEIRRQFEVHAALPPFVEDLEEPTTLDPPDYDGFIISEEIGRGSFGVVYRAWEKSLNRTVALKVLGDYGEPSPDERERFISEAQSAARMKHPNIVLIHAVGSEPRRPYLCLELVEGGTLADFVSGRPQPLRESAELAAQLADAVDYAHQRGIVHCDLKPQNVLLEYRSEGIRRRAAEARAASAGGTDSIPGGNAAPKPTLRLSDFHAKITDFGLARDLTLDDELGFQRLAGTLPYMAPEQLSEQAGAVGPATDIYGLGAILLEMLTGRPPHVGATRLELYLQVRDGTPPAPSSLRPDIPPDLDAICRKCLARDPAQRYARAGDLADDLRRFLAGREVSARPLGPVARVGRGLRRNQVVASLALLLVAATVAGVAAKLWGPSAADAAALQYVNEFLSARQAWSDADAGKAAMILDATDPLQRSIEYGLLRREIAGRRTQFPTDQANVGCLVYSPDGRTAAVADLTGPISLVDLSSDKTRHVLSGHGYRKSPPVFSRDGKSLAIAGMEQQYGYAHVWNVETGKLVRKIGPLDGPGLAAAFVDDGRRLRTLARNERSGMPLLIETWDIATGRRIDRIEGPPTVSAVPLPIGELSNDGQRFAWTLSPMLFDGKRKGQVVVGDAETGHVLDNVPVARGPVGRLLFSPDGLRIAVCTAEGVARIYEVADIKRVVELNGHADIVMDASFSADGSRIATGSRDQTVKLWDAATGRQLATPGRHTRLVQAVALDPHGATLLSSAESGVLSRWDLNSRDFATLEEANRVTAVTLSADGSRLIVNDVLHRTTIRDTGDPSSPVVLTREFADFAISRDGKRLAAIDPDGKLYVTPEGASLETMEVVSGLPSLNAGGADALAWSADGRRIAGVADDKKTVLLFEVRDPSKRIEIATTHAAIVGLTIRADGEQLATIGYDDPTVQLRSTSDGRLERTIAAEAPMRAVAFRAVGDDLATIPIQGFQIDVWAGRTGERRLRIAAHKLSVDCLAGSPDGRRWLSGGGDKLVKIFDAETGTELFALDGPSGSVKRLAVGADGRTIAAAAERGSESEILVWRVD
jgi:eukaryotic-like serine/threonine-protein kinase